MCHIGFVSDNGQPFVIPTGYARDGETLYFHGSVGSRMLRALETGAGQGHPAQHRAFISEQCQLVLLIQ